MNWLKLDRTISHVLPTLRGCPLSTWLALVSEMDDTGTARVGVSSLCRSTGYSRRQTLRALALLCRMGMISTLRVTGLTSSYTLRMGVAAGSDNPVPVPASLADALDEHNGKELP